MSASNKQSKPSDHSFGYAAIELKLTSESNQSYYLANHRLLRYTQRLPNAKNSCHWMKMNMARYSILRTSFQNNLCRLSRKLTFQKISYHERYNKGWFESKSIKITATLGLGV